MLRSTPCPARWSLTLLAIALLSACDSSPAPGPTQPGPQPPPPTNRWSDPNTWPNKTLPASGSDVVIPAGKTILLDTVPPPLGALQVDGGLTFDAKDLTLSAQYIKVNGHFTIGTESAPYTHRALITLTGDISQEGALGPASNAISVQPGAVLELHGAPKVGWTRLNATAAVGATQLTLLKAVDWQVGDNIIIASTDYEPLHAELRVVKSVSGATVGLTQALKYAHYGVVQTIAGQQLDERAEVGVLSRNITIRGADSCAANGYCGHVITFQGGQMRIEGVELYQMGQKARVARYPIHWHLAADVSGQYARNNAIWHSMNRCVTVHGTHSANVSGNVCYDDIGHGYFLEDGIEHNNVFEGNLGLMQQIPASGQAVIPSDAQPATFWITNPSNSYKNNVAAGSRGFGFWVALPQHPTGLSATASVWPRRTPLGTFTGNVAHSNRLNGLNVDNGPDSTLNPETTNYTPRQNPADGNSTPVVASFDHFTAYKHAQRGVWLRGANLRLSFPLLADNAIGATFAANETFLQDGVMIGESGNNNQMLTNGFPIRGYEFYDGRVGTDRTLFANYVTNGTRMASALGYNRTNEFSISPSNYVSTVRLSNANQVFLDDPHVNDDGDAAALFLDSDGSVTGTAGMFVVTNQPILLNGACTRHDEWNASACANHYVQLYMYSDAGEVVAPMVITRDDAVAVTLDGVAGVGGDHKSAAMSLLTGRQYTLQLSAVPSQARLSFRSVTPGDAMRLGLAYPAAPAKVWRDYDSSHPLAAAASLDELDSSSGEKYFYDAGAGVLYVKMVGQASRNYATIFINQN